MRIAVTDIGRVFGRQTRAYAEYRIFSKVARYGAIVEEVQVSLASPSPDSGGPVRCVVVLVMEGGGRLRVSARGRHVYDAINRAADRSSEELRRHTDIALSS